MSRWPRVTCAWDITQPCAKKRNHKSREFWLVRGSSTTRIKRQQVGDNLLGWCHMTENVDALTHGCTSGRLFMEIKLYRLPVRIRTWIFRAHVIWFLWNLVHSYFCLPSNLDKQALELTTPWDTGNSWSVVMCHGLSNYTLIIHGLDNFDKLNDTQTA